MPDDKTGHGISHKNITYIQNSKKPALICSYENILSNPLEFTKLINKFIGNPVKNENDLKKFSKAINPFKGYETNQNKKKNYNLQA